MGSSNRLRSARVAVVSVCAVALVVAFGTAQAAPVVIRGIGTRWSPTSVTVSRGSTVRWRGVSSFHDVVAYGSNWQFNEGLPAGSAVERRFRLTGTFLFRCTYHSTLIGHSCRGMCGSVQVTP